MSKTIENNSNQEQKYLFPAHRIRQIDQFKVPKTAEGACSGVILVSCGSFNPVTFLHLRIFESARDYFEKEMKIPVLGGFLSPVHQGYASRKPGLISAEQRVEMCKLAVSDSDWLAVDDWEVKQKEYSRTRFVLGHFREELKNYVKNSENVRIVLLCGADLLESLVKPGVWRPEDVAFILSTNGVACVEREDISISRLIFEHDVLYRNRKNIFVIPNFITNDVSSTKVRKLIQRGYSLKYYVHDKVIQYIKDKKLYS